MKIYEWALAVNCLFVVGLLVSLVWAGFAIGHHEKFQERMAICFMFQGVCILFLIVRKILRRGD